VDRLLIPVASPVRGIAEMVQSRCGSKKLPAGETVQRTDAQLAAENALLRDQVVFLDQQLKDLKLVEDERKRLGKLLDYFKPVGVIGGDASPDRDSISLMPASGVDLTPGKAVMCTEGLVGRVAEGSRVRLITDRDFIVVGQFGRWNDG
jgi:cell shape-determining protein MreC